MLNAVSLPAAGGEDTEGIVQSAAIEEPGSRATELMAIDSLLPCDSPRVAGEDVEHTRTLAEMDAVPPPITVHRSTLRVIDGMHRLRAAERRGDKKIEVRFFDGSDEEAFLLAVKLNDQHGLPLSREDRTAAADRLINSHPEWSDRRIAKATGLTAKTVAATRRRSTGADPQLKARVGRDGRIRPLSPAEGRRRAYEVVTDRPQATLREIAAAAGIALATARDVRERAHKGEDPVPRKLREAEACIADSGASTAKGLRVSRSDPEPRIAQESAPAQSSSALLSLRRDPSLRHTEVGRLLLHLLSMHTLGVEDWERLIEGIPAHRRHMVAEAARGCAVGWSNFAQAIENRTQAIP